MFSEKHRSKCYGYCHLCPLFNNGIWVRAIFKLRVDRNHRMSYTHKDQKVQRPNSDFVGTPTPDHGGVCLGGPSIHYESLQFQLLNYDEMDGGEIFQMLWNDAGESRPEYIKRLHGNEPSARTSLLVAPEGWHDRRTTTGGSVALQDVGRFTPIAVRWHSWLCPPEVIPVAGRACTGCERPGRSGRRGGREQATG